MGEYPEILFDDGTFDYPKSYPSQEGDFEYIIGADVDDDSLEYDTESSEILVSVFSDSVYLEQSDTWSRDAVQSLLNDNKGDQIKVDSIIHLTKKQLETFLEIIKAK